MKNLFKKDSLILGIILGIVLPALVFGIFFIPSKLLAPTGSDFLIKISTLILIAMVPNLFLMRYYLLKLQFDKTGRGLLLTTFLVAICYFVYYLRIL